MKKVTKILLAILSGVLLAPAYFQWGTGFIMFIALIPILIVEDELYNRRKELKTKSIFLYLVITFMLFTLLTVWWVKNSVVIGLVAALIVNPTFMIIPFLLFHYVKRNVGPRLGYFSLIALWIAFEYLFLNVQVNFPWIIFGNAFANDVKFIQWYEITGTLGGSLWVLLMNILFFNLFKGLRQNFSFKANRSKFSWTFGFLIVPIIFSLIRFYTYEEEYRPYECVVIQPNIDPNEKFFAIPQAQQTSYLLEEAHALCTESTDYIIAPETFLSNNVWHENIDLHPEIRKFYKFLEEFPDTKFIVGAMTYKRYMKGDSLSSTAKALGKGPDFFDSYNSALQLDRTGKLQMYHKSLLVTGAEWMPAFNKYKFIQKMAIDLGGMTRSHGTQEERSTFISPQDGLKVAPVICWESIFGEYVTKYVKDKDAELIFIITNDGWWGDTPGHRQHNSFARLRAIETRRSIARSANTGISCMINQRGEELERIGWWKRSAFKGILNANDHLTFYVKHGDYIARIAAFLSVLFVLYAFVRKRLINKKSK
ncbi:apolipoprotein N-acyltransferase [Bacteroidota bacterium]